MLPALSPSDVKGAVRALLTIEDEEALERAVAAAVPPVAARAVSAAPTLDRKSTLLWAMEDRQRREVLDMLPPPVIAALVQNLEDENRYLLGDLSLEQFSSLLSLCSPERQYYWIATALSFTDARANALPLLLPTPLLIDLLLTRPQFQDHVRLLVEYPLESQRIPPDMLRDPVQGLVDYFSGEGLLRQFPVADPVLERVLQTILDMDPDRYVDLIREGLRRLDYTENHPEEWSALTEEPVLLEQLDLLPEDAGPAAEAFDEGRVLIEETEPLALVPVTAPPLVRMADALAPAEQRRVAAELQQLYVRQAVAEGGSFAEEDLRRAASSVEAYLLLGLALESRGQAADESRVLAERPLHKISQSGARVIEGLRQVALRIQPLQALLTVEDRALLRSVLRPRMVLSPEGEPRLFLLPGGDLPEEADVPTVARLLQETAAWSSVVRVLGIARTEAAVAAGSVERLREELALAAVLYSRVEIGLAEPSDRKRFRERYVMPDGALSPGAGETLRRTVAPWAEAEGLEPEPTAAVLERALVGMAGSA